jgi:vacuolar-type H+-ATPase subunit I/STV1|tara:strand:- start:41 stop:415 length:375 start_codon:yes stop_codon:yes gene_type:complete
MGKFKEIDLFCEKGDKEGLIAFLAEHGIQNPHKQANIYLEEYKMANKTVKISDINKEIAAEMQLELTNNNISDLLSERISTLGETLDILSKRVSLVNKKLEDLTNFCYEEELKRLDKELDEHGM